MASGVGQCIKSFSASLTLFSLSVYSFDQRFFVNSAKGTSVTHKMQIDLHVCHRIYTMGESHECFSCMILTGTLILPLLGYKFVNLISHPVPLRNEYTRRAEHCIFELIYLITRQQFWGTNGRFFKNAGSSELKLFMNLN